MLWLVVWLAAALHMNAERANKGFSMHVSDSVAKSELKEVAYCLGTYIK